MYKILTTILIAFLSNSAWALDISALTSGRITGNQTFTGALGLDFSVLSSIFVTEIGAYDSDQNGFVNPIQVAIYNRDTQTLVAPPTSFSGQNQTLSGKYRYADVADFLLAPGNYSVVAVGFSGADPNGNSNAGGSSPTVDTGGSQIGFVGSGRWINLSTLVYPTNVDSGFPVPYDSASFRFTSASAVPERSASVLMFFGLLVYVIIFRRKKIFVSQ